MAPSIVRKRGGLAGALALTIAWAGCAPSCRDATAAPSFSGPCAAPYLYDDQGGILVLRGASVSAEAKWVDDRIPPQGPDALRRLRDDFGMNAIRLLVFWESIEPFPGVYDRAYLDAVRSYVDVAEQLGLHVIVDMHQDVYGRGFGHAGAPWWSCEDDLYERFEPQKPWFLSYLHREVALCFDRLYRPGETRAAFGAAWATLASRLRGSDSVLGYELINEPFWGSTTASIFEKETAPDFYRELTDVVRDADPEPFVLIQPSPSAGFGVPSELASPERERLVYGPHYYPAGVEVGTGYDGKREPLRDQLHVLCQDASRLAMPLVVGEFGVRRDIEGAEDFLRDTYHVFDEAQASAFYWSYQRGGDQSYGMLTREGEASSQGRAVARPYPARIAGVPIHWSWDPDEKEFTAAWEEDGRAVGDSILAVPRLAFPGGWEVHLDGDGTFEVEGSRVRIPPTGGRRDVRIAPSERRSDSAPPLPVPAHAVVPPAPTP